jgi:predicted DNA-binding protein YlxM (UPF0122 family)
MNKEDENIMLKFLSKLEKNRTAQINSTIKLEKKNILKENPRINAFLLEQYLTYILVSKYKLHPVDVANSLNIDRTTVYYNIKRINQDIQVYATGKKKRNNPIKQLIDYLNNKIKLPTTNCER